MSNSSNTSKPRFTIFSVFCGLIGFVTAFVLTPLFFESSRYWVRDYTETHYWDWLAGPAQGVWFLLCGLMVFCGGYLAVVLIRLAVRAGAAMIGTYQR